MITNKNIKNNDELQNILDIVLDKLSDNRRGRPEMTVDLDEGTFLFEPYIFTPLSDIDDKRKRIESNPYTRHLSGEFIKNKKKWRYLAWEEAGTTHMCIYFELKK